MAQEHAVMAENRTNQNADWNQSGERQANDVADAEHREHDHGNEPGPGNTQASSGRVEGRDRAPVRGGRDPDDPWMGGG